METNRNRASSRAHRGNRDLREGRDEFRQTGMGDSYRNEDYYHNPYERSQSFSNRDDDDRNFWTAQNQDGSQWQEDADDFNRESEGRRRERDTGDFRNEGRRFEQDFRSGRDNGNRSGREIGEGSHKGYRGRSSDDYRNPYRDPHYYEPSEFHSSGRSRDFEEENNFRSGEKTRAHRGSSEGRMNWDEDYNYYESYPSYGQGAPYNDHEYGYIRKQEAMGRRGMDNEDDYNARRRDDTGQTRRFAENEYGRRRRPVIRDKRY